MINKKLLLSVAVLSLLYSGCTEEEPKVVVESTKKVEVETVKKVEKVEKKVIKAEAPVVESVKEVIAVPDATILYKKCAACHGLNAEKKALNNSQIIKDWEATKIAEALKGYQNGTYGGAMKGLMVGQVKNLSDTQIDTLSKHIASFN